MTKKNTSIIGPGNVEIITTKKNWRKGKDIEDKITFSHASSVIVVYKRIPSRPQKSNN